MRTYIGGQEWTGIQKNVSVGFSGGVGVSWVSIVRKVSGLFWAALVIENLDGEGMDYTVKQ